MPKLYPGITQPVGRGRFFVFFLTSVFFPFFLLAQPTITSFAPLSGPIGTTVTITGSNFNATPSSNVVYFGAAKATVSAASTTSLTVTVPTGASYEPLTVTTGGLTAFSTKLFNVTFSDPGQFTAQAFGTTQPKSTGAANPVAICAKDLDGDGKTDLAVIAGTDLLVYSNASTPGFPQFNQLTTSYTPDPLDYPVTVAVGDLDGDGKPDLAVSMLYSAYIYIYLNTSTPGNISFSTMPPFQLSASLNIVNMVIADVNGDGKPDIAASSENGPTSDANVYTNASTPGSLSFPSKTNLPMSSTPYPGMILIADLDGDGMPDIAFTEYNSSQVYLYHNTGTPGGPVSFTVAPAVVTGPPTDSHNMAPGPFGLAAADLDGDGKIDLVAGNQSQNDLVLLRNTSSPGNINFTAEPSTPSAVAWSGNIVISDLDGDGLPDVSLVASTGSDSVYVYRNTSTPGHIGLASYVNYLANSGAFWLAAADLDGDGLPDLSVANSGQSYISILINKKADGISITSFSPISGVTGTTVTITGTNFTGVNDVSIGGIEAIPFTVVSPTTITATVGAGASGLVKVTTPTSFATKDGFTFNIQPQTITTFSPQTGSAGIVVLIEGTGFLVNGVNGVSFGGTNAASYTKISDTEISAVVGQGSTGSVRVISPASTVVSSANFIYTTAVPVGPPSVTSFSPLSATQGTDITIIGSNFSNVTGVTFGGTPAQLIQIKSDNIIVARVAGGTTGDVSVTGSNGTVSYPGFTFLTAPPPPAPPKITAFSPQSAGSGMNVNIRGINLSDVTTVTFGGSLSASIIHMSDTLIVGVVGTGATGRVRVASAAGADSLNGFVYVQDTTQTAPTGGVFQLVQFSGAINNNQPRLNWQVRNDGAISYYAVERSIDGSLFNVIGTVPVSNKTGTGHNYTFSDLSPKNGVNFYRLKMQDTTTHFVYSSAIQLQLSGGSAPLLAIYPNPVKYGFFLVDLPATANASVFRLSDFSGRIIKIQAVPTGVPQVRIDVPGIPRGTYQLSWTDGTRTAYQTILVL
jgi:hypothetical protein